MARFPEAEKRLLLKMICMNCYARNAMRATRCRKCRSNKLPPEGEGTAKGVGLARSARFTLP